MATSPESLQSPDETHGEAVLRFTQNALNRVQQPRDSSTETSDVVGDVTQIGD